MAGLAFIDYPIARNGGILFLAAEGGSEIPARLQAVLKAKYPDRVDKLPFAWIDECPRLLAPPPSMPLPRLPARPPSTCKKTSVSR